MIIRSEFIRLSGQAAHLTRTDTNRTVAIRIDLTRDAPDDLLDMTRFFAAIARSNPRTERDLVHVKISPAHPLTDAQLVRALEVLEEEFCIAPSTPRGVVEHDKGDRPRHFHVLYPIVDLATGRAIRSEDNFLKDELVSRRLELAFGEPIVPGPRMTEVIEELVRRGHTEAVKALKPYSAIPSGARFGNEIRQQAERLGVNLQNFAERVLGCWTDAAGNANAFVDGLAQCEMRLAAGNKAVLVLDDATGFSAPLARVLRQAAKARGAPIEIREPELRAMIPQLPASEEARDTGLQKAAADGQRAVDKEIARFVAEAIEDDQRDLAMRLEKARERERRRRRDERRRTLKERRAEITALHRRRDRIRRARVHRAFLAARWSASPAVRKIAFATAAGVVALAGGGLGAALVAGGLAVCLLPDYERARALAACEAAARVRDNAERGDLMTKAYAELTRNADKLDFNRIRKVDRVAAGYIAHCAVIGEAKLQGDPLVELRRAERCIGSDLSEEIRRAVLAGPQGGAERLLGWYRHGDPASAKALKAALRTHERQVVIVREGRTR